MDNNQDDEFHADLIALLFGDEGDNQEVGVEEIPEAFEGVQENVEGFVQNPEEGLGVEGVQVQENVEGFVQNPEEVLGVEGNPQVVQVQENVEGFVQNPEEGLGVGGNPQVVQVQENPAADAEQAQGAEILSDLDKAVVVYNARDSHDDHVGTSKKRGRPRKYATPEEARAAKTEKQRQRRRQRRITAVQGGEIPTDDTDQELESVLEEDTESTAENKPSREITDEEFDDSHKVFEDCHDDSEFSWKEPSEPNPEECSGVPRNKISFETTTEVEALERKHPEPSEPNPEGPKQSPTC